MIVGRRPARIVWSTLVLCTLAKGTAQAQVGRPSGERDVAVVTLQESTSVEDNGAYGSSEVNEPQNQGRRIFTSVNAAFTYNDALRKALSWQLNATAAARRYESLNQWLPTAYSVSGGMSFAPSRWSRFSISQGVSYLPNYSLALGVPTPGTTDQATLSSALIAAATDADPQGTATAGAASPLQADATQPMASYSVVKRAAYSSSTGAAASISLGQHSSLTMDGTYFITQFANRIDPSLTSWSGSARFQQQVSRYIGYHLGYGRREGTYGLESGTKVARIDDLDVGLDLSRALTLYHSRKTKIGFGFGSSINSSYHPALDGTVDTRHTLAVTGNATLDHAFGRTGHLTATYRRSLGLLQGFVAPVFSDSLSVGVNNRLGSRMAMASSATYTLGDVGAVETANHYRALTGSARLSVALAHRWSLFGGYTYYQQNVGDGVQLLGNLPRLQHRQAVEVGMTLAMPLMTERAQERK